MRFDKIFLNAKRYDRFEFEGSFIVKGVNVHRCWHCNQPTTWIDGNFMAYLCSEKCHRAKWDEYFEALKN